MTTLDEYRDDGVVSGLLGRAARTVLPRWGGVPVALTALAAVPLLGLVVWARSLPDGYQVISNGFLLSDANDVLNAQNPWAPILAVVVLVLLAGAASGRSLGGRLDWLVPPLLRVLEYGTVALVTRYVAPEAMPFCYALLAAVAFHHYDTVYRLRHRRVPPPTWVRLLGGGWDVRLLLVALLAGTGGLRAGLLVGAVALGILFVTESVAGWLRKEDS